MTNREIIERVKSMYQKGVSSDDNRMSNRLIYSVISSIRLTLLSQLASKRRFLSSRNYDYLECIPMELAEPYECPCAPPSGCKILKSKCTIPRALSTKFGDYVEGVTSIDGSSTFSKTTWIAKSKKKANKYTSKTRDYFFKDDYLFITVPDPQLLTLKAVTVSGIFEDITKFYCNYCSNCEEDTGKCISPLDMEFKLEGSLIEPLLQIAKDELIDLFARGRDDKSNNSEDNAQESK